MKKIICIILATLFYLLGIIGIIIPIIPQVPFLVIGTIFLIIGFKSVKAKIIENKFYKEHVKVVVENNKMLSKILDIENKK